MLPWFFKPKTITYSTRYQRHFYHDYGGGLKVNGNRLFAITRIIRIISLEITPFS